MRRWKFPSFSVWCLIHTFMPEPTNARPHARRLKPWPNGTPNSSQVFNLAQAGYRLATHLARIGLNLIKLKCSPNSSKVFHPGQLEQSFSPRPTRAKFFTQANSSKVFHPGQLEPSCLVVVSWLRGRSQTIAKFLPSWFDLAVPFGHSPMQVLIL